MRSASSSSGTTELVADNTVVEAIGAEHASKFSGRVPKVTVEVRR